MKKAKMIIASMFVFLTLFAVKETALAADGLERTYYKVVNGTATKLGTEKTETVKSDVYLEEWQVPKEMVLAEDVADVLLKSSNVEDLPIMVDKLDYSTLKKLATEAAEEKLNKEEPIYQGYSQLGLKDAKSGYTFGIVVDEAVTGECLVTGYYADLHNKAIYKIELICENTSKEEMLQSYAVKVQTSSEDYSSDSSESTSSAPTPTPPTPEEPTPPEPETPVPETPTPPAPPSNPPIKPPSVPIPVLPGA